MTSLFVKQLTTLDFSYLCPERGLVGESWLVDVTLSGELDEQGMVFDFGHVKKQIKATLDNLADHRLLVPIGSSATSVSYPKDQLLVEFRQHSRVIRCLSPAQAILLVDCPEISIANLKPYLEQEVLKELPDNVSSVELTLYHETIDSAFYHYSHGLKKHLGNCQRIAHGHRSRIEILLNNQRSDQLEQQWAASWRDIYIASREDLLKTLKINELDHYQFGYTSDQGYFELTIACDCCYLVDTDSTIELLAEHIASELAQSQTGKTISVIAYEGFNKGAHAKARIEL